MNKLLWLDDLRNPFEGNWIEDYSPIKSTCEIIWVKDYQEFVDWISLNGLPTAICFDNDLAQDKEGYDADKWLVDYCIDNQKKLPLFNIQSANPAGKENIQRLLDNFKKYQEDEPRKI